MEVQIPLREWGNFEGEMGRPRTCLTMDILKATQQGQNRYYADADKGCTLASPGEYDCTVRVRRQCGFISNYFDHSFWVPL